MDRPLERPRNTFRARAKRFILTTVGLFAIVFGVAALPVAFLYFAGQPLELIKDIERQQSPQPPEAARRGRGVGRAQQEYRPVAFLNVSVVPMDRERIIPNQTVVIEEGQITEIGPADKVSIPRAALRVDGRGKYLMPGLADMHVHFHFGEPENYAFLQLFVANGVTTVLSMHGNSMILDLREQVASGERLGPTIYTAGPEVNEPRVSTPEEVERAVVEQKRAGYDFIKMHGELSREAYRRLFEVSRREGIRVVGHAPRRLGIEVLLEERQEAIAHAEEYLYAYFRFNRKAPEDPKEIDSMVRYISQATAKAGIWVIPTLTVYKGIGLQVEDVDAVLRRPEVKYVPPQVARYWSPANNTYVRRFKKETAPLFKSSYSLLEKLVKGLNDAGVRLLAGTDTPVPSVVPGFSIYDELRDLVASGLTPYQSLRTATANAAEFLKIEREAGTVEVGKRADLILVEGDPLKDVSNAARHAGVMVRGRWIGADELRAMLDELRSRN